MIDVINLYDFDDAETLMMELDMGVELCRADDCRLGASSPSASGSAR